MAWSSSPSAKMTALRRRILETTSVRGWPAVSRRPRASGMATPTMNRKNGKMRSVGVQPCHSACRSGGYTARHVPGLLTSTIAATVSPRNASSETSRPGRLRDSMVRHQNPHRRVSYHGVTQRHIDAPSEGGAMLEPETPHDLLKLVGQELGPSDWMTVDQAMIDKFAEATGDHQWIHVDVERAKREMPGGKTIAHGYLTLSLVPRMAATLMRVKKRTRGLNYG